MSLCFEKSPLYIAQNLSLPCWKAHSEARARPRPRVDGGEREVLEHEAHLVAVVLEHVVLERGVDPRAERALEVRVLDDGHLRVLGAALGLIVERDLAHDLRERIDGEVDQVAAEGVVPSAVT